MRIRADKFCRGVYDSFPAENGVRVHVPDEKREQALNDAIREYGSFIFWYLN